MCKSKIKKNSLIQVEWTKTTQLTSRTTNQKQKLRVD
jgi:hypothetical protein